MATASHPPPPDLDDEWYAGEDSGYAHETHAATDYEAFGVSATNTSTANGARGGKQQHRFGGGDASANGGAAEAEVDLFYDSSILPPFLAATEHHRTHDDEDGSGGVVATREQDIRLPVKDAMSRMATWAKEGSEALRLFRREEQARRANLEATDTSQSTVNALLRQTALSRGAAVTEEEYERLLRQARMERLRGATAEERSAIEAEDRAAEAKAIKEQGSMRDIDRVGGMGGGGTNNDVDMSTEEGRRRYYAALRDKLAPSRRRLPVYRVREALLDYIAANQVCVIEGETGSGKTTQLVQYLLEAGYAGPGRGIIGCTQPRKVAAVGVSKRVADEVGCELGTTVGYAVRLDNRSGPSTQIKFMTEGVLLREVIHDPDVAKYSVIVLDEAHERSIDTDVLLGVLKGVVRRRSDLKVIVTSATMNTQKFSDFFYGAKAFKIPGKVFPVDVVYEPPLSLARPDYIEDVVAKVMELHLDRHHLLAQIGQEKPKEGGGGPNDGAVLGDKRMREDGTVEEGEAGEEVRELTAEEKAAAEEKAFAEALAKLTGADEDEAAADPSAESAGLDILVFLPGKEEILSVIGMVKAKLADRPKRFLDSLLLIPLYSELPPAQQLKALEPTPPGMRKCVVSTNVAETSLTIDGIRFVVDAGYMKTNVYRPAIGMNSLQTYPISQAEANQRKGRAGRTARGVCYRLYGEEQFNEEMLVSPVPEIQRSSIDSVVLLLKSIGVDNLMHFDFIDPPPEATIRDSCYKLWLLGALDGKGSVTKEGLRMLEFPVEPSLAKMLLVSARPEFRCSSEMLSVAAMISAETRTLFVSPPGREEQCRQERGKFNVANSDHLTLLNIFTQFDRSGKSKSWARDNYLDHRTLQRAVDIRAQFTDKMRAARLPLHQPALSIDEVGERLRQVLCYGHTSQVAKRVKWTEYESLQSGVSCAVSPASAIVEAGGASMPPYCIYNEFRQTTKEYMCLVTEVQPEWVVRAARGVIRERGVPYDAAAQRVEEEREKAEAESEAARAAEKKQQRASAQLRPQQQQQQQPTTSAVAQQQLQQVGNGLLAPPPAAIAAPQPLQQFQPPPINKPLVGTDHSRSLAQSLRDAAAASASIGLGGSALFAAPPTPGASPHPPVDANALRGASVATHTSAAPSSSPAAAFAAPSSAASNAPTAISAAAASTASKPPAPRPVGKVLSPLELAKQKMAAAKKKSTL